MTSIDPIPRRKLYQEVLDRLLARISSGEYAVGDQLPSERQLMEMYKVGRPAIREAMQTLSHMGLVSITHGERARVTPITADRVIEQVGETAKHFIAGAPENLEHLKEARVFFEVGMVRLAAERATEEDIGRLARRLEDHRDALTDLPNFLPCDMAFHREIATISGNPIYVAVSQAMFAWLAVYHVKLLRAPGAELITIEEHERIFDAVADRDPDEAAAAMSDHLKRASQLYRQFES
ncbi:transcriptional regulator NanR [Skermanella rosea]|uniref:transcriptional regulator NanR n=1 Tax=Skermanella rosea TaxID=1817965 RepID=UPI001933CAF7|nr:transcriptional regulator NanR [Skermanella rosea]UEM02524.1 transcriptional regulator NanR [Skermanella rosea]